MLAFLSGRLGAQEPAFSWARASVGAAWMEPRFPEGDFWDPGRAVAVRLQTSLRPGLLALGVERHRVLALADVTDPAVGRMTWSVLYLGWGGGHRVGLARVGLEGRLGTLVNTAPVGVSNRTERELVVGGAAWLDVDLPGGWFTRAEASGARVHSSTPWTVVGLGVGVGRRIGLGRLGAALRAPDPLGVRSGAAPGEDGLPRVERRGSSTRALDADVASAEAPVGTTGRWASFPELPGEAFGDPGASTDRVDRLWSPGALRAPEAGAAAVWLDGIPIRDMTLGGPAWPTLPIGSGDLLSVRATTRPEVVMGRPELEGALHATTAPPRPGDRVRVRAMIVNESGDPGPLRFTPLTSPNVDGPLYEFDASVGHPWSSGWLLVSAALRERWSVTRGELRGRNAAFVRGSESRARTGGIGVAVGERVGRGDLRIRAWSTGVDRFLRTPGLGAELGVDGASRGVGGSVRTSLGTADTLRAYAALARWAAVAPPDRLPPSGDPRTLDWSEQDVDVGFSYLRTLRALAVTVGGDLRRAREGGRPPRRDGGGHATVEVARGGWAHRLTALVGTQDYGRGALIRSRRDVASRGWLAASAGVTSGGPKGALELVDVAAGDTALIGALGIGLVPRAGAEGVGVLDVERGRRIAYGLGAGWRGARGFFAIELHRRDFDGERRPAVTYRPVGPGVRGLWGPSEAAEGRVWSIAVRGEGRPSERLTVAAHGEAVRPRGDEAFDRWWGGAPRLRVTVSAVLGLRAGWNVVAIARGRTAASWAGVGPLETVPDGGSISAGVDTDVRLEGSVLAGRVEVVAGITNLFDADVRLHPLGAGEARGLVAGLGLRF